MIYLEARPRYSTWIEVSWETRLWITWGNSAAPLAILRQWMLRVHFYYNFIFVYALWLFQLNLNLANGDLVQTMFSHSNMNIKNHGPLFCSTCSRARGQDSRPGSPACAGLRGLVHRQWLQWLYSLQSFQLAALFPDLSKILKKTRVLYHTELPPENWLQSTKPSAGIHHNRIR